MENNKRLDKMLKKSMVTITGKELIENLKEPKGKFTPCTIDANAKKFGKWKVSKKGDMNYQNGRYYISKEQLNQDNWIAHLFGKIWIDWNEFIPAYFQACKNAGIKSLNIKIFY